MISFGCRSRLRMLLLPLVELGHSKGFNMVHPIGHPIATRLFRVQLAIHGGS